MPYSWLVVILYNLNTFIIIYFKFHIRISQTRCTTAFAAHPKRHSYLVVISKMGVTSFAVDVSQEVSRPRPLSQLSLGKLNIATFVWKTLKIKECFARGRRIKISTCKLQLVDPSEETEDDVSGLEDLDDIIDNFIPVSFSTC